MTIDWHVENDEYNGSVLGVDLFTLFWEAKNGIGFERI